MALFGMTPRLLKVSLLPAAGFCFGWFLDYEETLRMTLFRDKSALYGGNVKPGDPPSWP